MAALRSGAVTAFLVGIPSTTKELPSASVSDGTRSTDQLHELHYRPAGQEVFSLRRCRDSYAFCAPGTPAHPSLGGDRLNVQNIPRSDKIVKKAFLPKHDALLFFDYKQIEPRLLAHYLAVAVGDDRLAEAIKNGVDPYTAIVAPMYGKTPETLTEEERQTGKRLFLSLQYGGGVKTIIAQWKVDYPTAKSMYDQFHNTWPSVKMLNNMLNATVKDRGFVRSIMGRHLRPDSEHKAVNSVCQGSAAEFMRKSLVLADRFCGENLLVSHLVLTIHDELVIDSHEDEIPLLVERIPVLMDCFPEVSAVVPIQVDVEISRSNWAAKEEYVELVAV